jgi:DNA-directed RNA polymerase subunit F
VKKMQEIYFDKLPENIEYLRHIGQFSPEFQIASANLLIAQGKSLDVTRHIAEFDPQTHREISLLINNYFQFAEGRHAWQFSQIFKHPHDFSKIHPDVALKMQMLGNEDAVIEHIQKYEGLDHQQFTNLLEPAKIASNIHKFKGLNQRTLETLLRVPAEDSEGRGVNFNYVLRNLSVFEIEDYQKIADILIDLNQAEHLVEHIDEFRNLSPETAYKLLPIRPFIVARYSDRFPGLSQQELADRLIALNNQKVIVEEFKDFSGLSQDTIEKIITEDTHLEFVRKIQSLDLERYDQEALAAKLIEAQRNIYFSGIKLLPKYSFLTRDQLNYLHEAPQERRVELLGAMSDDVSAV